MGVKARQDYIDYCVSLPCWVADLVMTNDMIASKAKKRRERLKRKHLEMYSQITRSQLLMRTSEVEK